MSYGRRSVTLVLRWDGREDTRFPSDPATRYHHFGLLSLELGDSYHLRTRDRTGRAGLRGPARPVSIPAPMREQPYAGRMDKWSRLDRLVARVTGEDPIAFLDATTTQDLTGLAKGDSVLTCMLDEKGRVQAEMRVTLAEDGWVLIDAEQPARDAITGWLAKIAPLSGCEVIDESDRWNVVALFGASSAPPGAIALVSDWGPSDLEVLIPSSVGVTGHEIGEAGYEAARIASGRPLFGVDFDESTHIAET